MSTGHKKDTHHRRSPLVCLALACIAVVLAIGAVTFTLIGRDRPLLEPEATLNLRLSGNVGRGADPALSASGPVLRVAIAPVISPESSVELYGELIAYLARKLGRRPALLRGENYSEVNDLIRMRQCDMAMVCTYSYVLAEAAFGIKLLVAPELAGRTVYHSVILVPTASSVTDLSELRDRRFASCDVLSTSGWLYPMTYLKERGLDPDHFFREHVISGSHDRSVFAVRSGVVDAAAVDSLVYEQMLEADPALANHVKVIHRSPPFGMPPFVVPADLPAEDFDHLQEALLNMHNNPEGRGILDALGFDRFFIPADSAYDSVRLLHKSWHGAP